MRVRVDGQELTGRGVDLREFSVAADEVVRAVRGDAGQIAVDCPEPGPVHQHVGAIGPGMELRVRAALASAARSVGRTAPQDEELRALRRELAAFDVPTVDVREAKRRVADVSGTEAELRERVATLQGQVQALREADEDATDAEATLTTAIRRLAEAETERIAAEQALEQVEDERAAARDERRERLRLQDRESNLTRAARGHLAREMRESFADAIDAVAVHPAAAVSGAPDAGKESASVWETWTSPDDPERIVTAALAIVRLADVDAPVVLACDRFDSAASAATRLDARVVRV